MWLDFLKHQATAFGKQIAFVNLDETSIAVRFERKGAVARSSWWGGSAGPCRAKQPRGSATLICFSSPDEEIQRVLPQIFIGNHAVFPVKALRKVAADKPATCQLWREKSSWNNASLMRKVVDELQLIMTDFPDRQPCIVMDCATMHIGESIFRHFRAAGIWVVIVPPGCTSVLQPLDVETFGLLKRMLRENYVQACLEMDSCKLPIESWLRVLFSVSCFMTERSWRKGFLRSGIVGDREKLAEPLAKLRHKQFSVHNLYSELLKASWELYPPGVAKHVSMLLQAAVPELH